MTSRSNLWVILAQASQLAFKRVHGPFKSVRDGVLFAKWSAAVATVNALSYFAAVWDRDIHRR
jgi:hypothetical protein